ASGRYGICPSGGSETRLGERWSRERSSLRDGSPGGPASGSVKLLWLAMVLDQWPCTSGWPSGRRGPAHSPEWMTGTVPPHRLCMTCSGGTAPVAGADCADVGSGQAEANAARSGSLERRLIVHCPCGDSAARKAA